MNGSSEGKKFRFAMDGGGTLKARHCVRIMRSDHEKKSDQSGRRKDVMLEAHRGERSSDEEENEESRESRACEWHVTCESFFLATLPTPY